MKVFISDSFYLYSCFQIENESQNSAAYLELEPEAITHFIVLQRHYDGAADYAKCYEIVKVMALCDL